MKILKIITLTIFTMVLFSSCSSDEENENNSEVFNLMTQNGGIWDVTNFEQRQGSNAPWEQPDDLCSLDDKWEFTPSSTFMLFPGSDFCEGDGNDTPDFAGTFSLMANDTVISLLLAEFNNFEVRYAIQSVTDTRLVITFGVGDLNDTEGRITMGK